MFQSPVCVLLMALVSLFFAVLLPVNDVRYPFVVDRSFAFVVRAEFQVGVHAEFQAQISPGMDFPPLAKSGVAAFAYVPHLRQNLLQ